MTIQGVREGMGRGLRSASTSLRRGGEGALGGVRALTNGDGQALAQGLGWFSVGLGLAELAAPSALARFIGVADDDDNVAVLRACGLRELASGVGILSTERPQSLLWGRVAGDVMDLLLLGTAGSARTTDKEKLTVAAVSVLGVTLLDVLSATQLSRSERGGPARVRSVRGGELARRGGRALQQRAGGVLSRLPRGSEAGIETTQVITVNRPVDEVYRFWHDFPNLARFMSHLESVELRGEKRSFWRAKAPLGTSVTWEAETVDDVPSERISWRSLPGADVDNAGVVTFKPAPGGRGTEVKVELFYRPPAGHVGATLAKLFGEAPEQQIKGDLRRFKQVMETGEVVHSDASIHRGMHPGQPSRR